MRRHTVLLLVIAGAWAAAGAQPFDPESCEHDGTWTLELRDRAQGAVARVHDPVRSGEWSLRLSKSYALGTVVLRTAEPLTFQTTGRYRFRGFFRSIDAPLSALLLFRLVRDPPDPQDLRYDSVDRSAGYPAHSLIVNAPPGAWVKRIVSIEAQAGQTVWPTVVLWGNPATVWLDDFELTARRILPPVRRGADYPGPVPDAQVLGRLAQRQESGSRVTAIGGRSVLHVDGRPAAPILYKGNPYEPGANDYAGFAADGIDLATVSMRLGPVKDKPGVWRGEGAYDFDLAEETLMEALRRNPEARLLVDWLVTPYPEWGVAHPDDCWQDTAGNRGYGFWGNLEGFTGDLDAPGPGRRVLWWYPSYHSRAWRQSAARAITDISAHLRTTPLWKAVVGAFLTGGHDGQFMAGFRHDYSPAAHAAWQAWLGQRYGSVESLTRAWGAAQEGFHAIAVPREGDPEAPPESAPPYADAALRDYRLFLVDEAWSLRDALAGACREAAGKPIVTIAYSGVAPMWSMSRLLSCAHLDAMGAMTHYPYRAPGYATGMLTPDSYHLHGKLFFQEIDLRSWVGSVYPDEVYQAWIGAGLDVGSWRSIHNKLAGQAAALGSGWWYYDMNRYFNDPAIHQQIAQTRAVFGRAAERRRTFRPDVCIVLHDDQRQAHGPYYSSVTAAAVFQNMMLETSGVPFDTHLLRDVLEHDGLQEYRVYVFHHTARIERALRERIDAVLKRDGRTIVWLYDSGYLDEAGPSLEAMSRLVGMTVRASPGYGRFTALLDDVDESDEPLRAGLATLPRFIGMSEMLLTMLSVRGRNGFIARYQRFWIDDARAVPLAHDTETGQAAAAVRRFDDWTSVYLAAPNSLGAELLHHIAQQAGAFVCADPGNAIWMSGDLAVLHGLRNGEARLKLPPGTRGVRDAAGRSIPLDERVRLPVEAGETHWLILE